MTTETIEQILEREIIMVKKIYENQGDIHPMIAVGYNKELAIFPLLGDFRDAAHSIMKKISKMKIDWAMCVAEAWQKAYPKNMEMNSIRHGDLQKLADYGDASVKSVIMLQVYNGKEKRAVTFDIVGNKLANRNDLGAEFDGYLKFGDEE